MSTTDSGSDRAHQLLRKVTGADEKPAIPTPFNVEETSRWPLLVFGGVVLLMILFGITVAVAGLY